MSGRAHYKLQEARVARAHREEVERLRAQIGELTLAARTLLDALDGAGEERGGLAVTIPEAVAQLRAVLEPRGSRQPKPVGDLTRAKARRALRRVGRRA